MPGLGPEIHFFGKRWSKRSKLLMFYDGIRGLHNETGVIDKVIIIISYKRKLKQFSFD